MCKRPYSARDSPLLYKWISSIKGNLKERLGEVIHLEALLHSDQRYSLYTPEFQKCVREMEIKQSMSRRGNCLDNAPIESFFGHMKGELDYKDCQTFESLSST